MPSTNRPTDFAYDPLYTTSGARDQMRHVAKAKMAAAKIQVCPIFTTMFSDLDHVPRQQVVMRHTNIPILQSTGIYEPMPERAVDVRGVDRFKFFASTPVRIIDRIVPPFQLEQPKKPKRRKPRRHVRMQTDYRESSAQTSPWQADYKLMEEGDFEILKLDFLKWGSGLPAGVHEITLIERARMKRAWEKAMPPVTCAANLEKRRKIIEALERDQWAFREKEIQDIQEMRLALLEKMIEEVQAKTKIRTEEKLKWFYELRQKQVSEKVAKLQKRNERALRKLKMRFEGKSERYVKWDAVEEFADVTSEMYAPLMRHGEDPKRRHFVVDHRLRQYKAQYEGIENMSVLPRWLNQMSRHKEFKCTRKLPGTRLCPRETKWTTPVLKQLHEELKCLRAPAKRPCSLRVRIEKEESPLTTPEGESIPDSEEDAYQAVVRLQSMLRGRAVQMLIFEGRDRCRELILELRSTHALQEDEIQQKYEQRLEAKYEQRDEEICLRNAKRLQESLDALQGSVVGSLLDFLNKELRRLLDERKSHALCLIAERERNKREAAESGRRQQEILRRSEHDEIFKQVVKVHQDTVDLYLQDIITEGMEFASEEEAQLFVQNLADKIDVELEESMDAEEDVCEQEEIVANLVHNFLLPEVEKRFVRERNNRKQKARLKTIHEELFAGIEDLPRPKSEKKSKKPMRKEKLKTEKREPSEPQMASEILIERHEPTEELHLTSTVSLGVVAPEMPVSDVESTTDMTFGLKTTTETEEGEFVSGPFDATEVLTETTDATRVTGSSEFGMTTPDEKLEVSEKTEVEVSEKFEDTMEKHEFVTESFEEPTTTEDAVETLPEPTETEKLEAAPITEEHVQEHDEPILTEHVEHIPEKHEEPPITEQLEEQPTITGKSEDTQTTEEPTTTETVEEPLQITEQIEPTITEKPEEPQITEKPEEPQITEKLEEPQITETVEEPTITEKPEEPPPITEKVEESTAEKLETPTGSSTFVIEESTTATTKIEETDQT